MSETRIPKDLQGIYKQAEGDDHYYGHLTKGLIERIGRAEAELPPAQGRGVRDGTMNWISVIARWLQRVGQVLGEIADGF